MYGVYNVTISLLKICIFLEFKFQARVVLPTVLLSLYVCNSIPDQICKVHSKITEASQFLCHSEMASVFV